MCSDAACLTSGCTSLSFLRQLTRVTIFLFPLGAQRMNNEGSGTVLDLERVSPSQVAFPSEVHSNTTGGCNWHLPTLPQLDSQSKSSFTPTRAYSAFHRPVQSFLEKRDVCDCCEHIPCHCVSAGYSTHSLGLFSSHTLSTCSSAMNV